MNNNVNNTSDIFNIKNIVKKTIILTLCFLLTIRCSYGQQNPDYFAKYHNYIYAAAVVGGAIYLIVKSKKNKSINPKTNSHSHSHSKKSNDAPSKKQNRENIKRYKTQVQELANETNTENDMQDKIITIQNLYEYAGNYDPSFNEKVSKYKAQFDGIKIKYSTLIYQKYFPDYDKERKLFKANLSSNKISDAKNNILKFNELKSELCWYKNENLEISNEIEIFNQAIEVYNKFQTKLSSIQNLIKSGTLNYPDNDILELTNLMHQLQSITKLSITLMESQIDEIMQPQIDEINCQYHKNLYSSLINKSEIILNQVVSINNIDEFNSSVNDFTSLIENVQEVNCVGNDKYKILKNSVVTKRNFENEKIEKEKELENEKILKEKEIASKKLKEEKPLEITNIMMYPNEIGVPVAIIMVTNNTDETIVAVDAEIRCYDAMGRKMNYFLSDSNLGLATFHENLYPEEEGSLTVTLNSNWEVQVIDVKIIRVRYENGKIVKLKKTIGYKYNSSNDN